MHPQGERVTLRIQPETLELLENIVMIHLGVVANVGLPKSIVIADCHGYVCSRFILQAYQKLILADPAYNALKLSSTLLEQNTAKIPLINLIFV